MHLPLVAAASVVGFFGGALLGAWVAVHLMRWVAAAGVGAPWLGTLVLPACFFGGAVLGLKGLARLVRLIPINCPRCNGRAWHVPDPQVMYRCAAHWYLHNFSGPCSGSETRLRPLDPSLLRDRSRG